MSYADIVIQVGSAPGEAERIAVAADLAHRMDARLHGVFVDATARSAEPQRRHPTANAARAAREAFVAATSHTVAGADWIALEPGAADAFLAQARKADLVIARPSDGADAFGPDHLAANCGRPVLVLPQGESGRRVGRCVLVAWNDSEDAWRALAAAMPLLKAADSIWVVHVAPNPAGFSAIDRALETFLGEQGLVPMMIRRCGPTIAGAVIEEAAACNADLIVMDLQTWRRLTEANLARPRRRRSRPAALIAG